jgi:GT2 family glycosyltransferase/glycosyltransferase involved in cell wall biosynthesis
METNNNSKSVISRIKHALWKIAIAIFCGLPISVATKEKIKQKIYQKFGKQVNAFKKSANNLPDDNQVTSSDLGNPETFIPWNNNKPGNKSTVKVIAFYLPQFHPIPENDKWWGKGFTEWTNVKPAEPQFEGHYQPHVPIDPGYYNLLNIKTFQRQIEIAKNYGIGGFCFHYYWFNKKRLLEKPIDLYLENPSLDLPFCISWANESWSRRWDGNEKNVLIRQNHSPEDDIDFISFASKYLKDKRYITIDGKPLIMIYRPDLLPDSVATTKRWRNWCKQNGIGDIYLAYVQSFEKTDPTIYGFDAAVEFPPNYFGAPYITHTVKPLKPDFKCNVLDWKFMADESENYQNPGYKLFRGICPSWDNTPRRKNESYVFINSNPERFKKWIYNAAVDTYKRFESRDERLVFVNAWNEWAEGAHLEPDQKYGYAFLQGVYEVLSEMENKTDKKNKPKLLVVSYDIPKPDKSSGELRFVGILDILLQFWDIDFCIAETRYEVNWTITDEMTPYFDNLKEMGINVLPFKEKTFNTAITNNKYAGVYFNLYWMAEKLILPFKEKQPTSYTIVDSVDVHFAREITQANLGEITMEQALNTKKEELAVYHQADAVVAVSKDDYSLLTNEEHVENVFIIPNVVPVYKRKTGKRKPIVIFIGSYTWPPNIDSVKWFSSEVWPIIIKHKPDARFLIIGSDPTEEVLALAEIEGIEVTGYVPETKPYLEMAAVSVAPLRYGGGMKGKVNEAMSYGLPVVATSIGAQGFSATNGKEMLIADGADEFAQCVVKLLLDDDLQQQIGLEGLKLNAAISSPESVKNNIKELFTFCEHGETNRQSDSNIEPPENKLKYPLPEKPKGILEFPEISSSPLVSIIIPVYNQWSYTFACLKSILDNSGNVPYEVIIADDNSTDETKNITRFVKNIHVISNEKNLGFLYNCNLAAKSAKGKYLVFLNNDTLVKSQWLKWFIKTMEEKPDVGLIGAKVIFATGKLQEAGSIIFKDGSAMNYGREDDPELPQYNYFKEVDYGSGCSICIRTELWKKAGGFDSRYAPAYYEDTDFAVQVRQMGYRTVYQPKTEIIHFEGVSHGTDLSEGIKKNQVKNQEIFFNKWREVFEKQNYNRDENLFRARERSMNKKMVLLVDHHVPDSSLKDNTKKTILLLNHFIESKYIIKFLPDNFERLGAFVDDFEQAGIEFLYGERCQYEWQQWMNENLKEFDLVCFADDTLKEKYYAVINEVISDNSKLKLYDHILKDEPVKEKA